jgi:hypothetical protein
MLYILLLAYDLHINVNQLKFTNICFKPLTCKFKFSQYKFKHCHVIIAVNFHCNKVGVFTKNGVFYYHNKYG